MTTPLIPERHGAASPTLRRFDKNSVQDWINVLHHASAVPAGHADYGEAQDVMQQALEQIGHLQRVASTEDRAAMAPEPTSLTASVIGGLAHGASLGVGEPIAGAVSALRGARARTGETFGSGAQQYRSGLDRLEESNPKGTAAAEITGMLAPSLIPGAQAVAGGTVLPGAKAATSLTNLMQLGERAAPIMQAAGSGLVLGGVSGFAHGGEDPGDFAARFDAAKREGIATALLNAAVAGGGTLLRARGARAEGQLAKDRADLQLQAPGKPIPVEPPPSPTVEALRRDVAAQLDPVATSGPMVNQPRPAGPEIRQGFPRLRVESGSPQGPPSPPTQGVAWPEPTPAQLAARQTGMPDKPLAELYPNAAAEAPPMSRPNELANPTPAELRATAERIAAKTGAKVVEPGPYQRAAPGTRMQTPRQGGDAFAEAIANDPASALAQLELAKALGVQPHPLMVEAVARALAKRKLKP